MGKQERLDQDSSSGGKPDLADVAVAATAQQPEPATGGFFSFFQRKGSEKRVLAEQIESAKGPAVAADHQPPKSVPEIAENGRKEEAVAVEKKEEPKPSTNGKILIISRIPGQ